MTTTDHRTVAEDMLTSASAAEPGSVDERYYVAAAHAHATLALVDENRLANLIATFAEANSTFRANGGFVNDSERDNMLQIRSQIAERLALS